MHDERQIRRVINGLDVRRQPAPQFSHPRGSGGGDDELEVGQARLQRAQQLQANADFTHADSVQPDDRTLAQGGFDLRAIEGKALAITEAPVAAPPHFHEMPRLAQPEKQDEQNIIRDSHPLPEKNQPQQY
jgi:hypothetical protein